MEGFSDVEDKTLVIAHEIGHALKLGHEKAVVVKTVMWSTESTEEHEGCAYSELSNPTYYDLLAVKQKLERVEA